MCVCVCDGVNSRPIKRVSMCVCVFIYVCVNVKHMSE